MQLICDIFGNHDQNYINTIRTGIVHFVNKCDISIARIIVPTCDSDLMSLFTH